MIKIDYPVHQYNIKTENGREWIFDNIRKSWLLLTPEEWVRQNFVQYLIINKGYPAALIALEKKLMLGELTRRFDILVYNADHQPLLMVECKAMQVALTHDVLDQVLRYHIAIPVQCLIITNGTYCMAFSKKNHQLVPLEDIPAFRSA